MNMMTRLGMGMLVAAAVIGFSLTGCAIRPGPTADPAVEPMPVPGTATPGSPARAPGAALLLPIQVVGPSASAFAATGDGVRPAIIAVPDGTLPVTIDAVLTTIGGGSFDTRSQQVTLSAGEVATITFTAVPIRSALARLAVANGRVRGVAALHAVRDLDAGPNVMRVVDVASTSRESIAAHCVGRMIGNPALLANATATVAAAALAAADRVNRGAATARDDAFAAFVASATLGASPAGVATIDRANHACTVIVHGFDPGLGGEPAWMAAMQRAILDRTGGAGQAGRMVVSGSKNNLTVTCDPWNFDFGIAPTGDVVIRVAWHQVANHLLTGVTAQEVAAAIAARIEQGQLAQRPLAELPIHLIGHSRGGGMVFEIARLLGERGIDVDHVTALDPHPLTTADSQPLFGAPVIDTPTAISENVLFADNYWQNLAYPRGQVIDGAWHRVFPVLGGGYHQAANTQLRSFADHLNVILAYHGSIALGTPVSNLEATLTASERTTWFADEDEGGARTGLRFARQVGWAERWRTDVPPGSTQAVAAGLTSDPAVGGRGARQPLSWGGAAVWPNVVAIEVLRGGQALGVGAQTITPGETLQIRLLHRDADGPSTVTILADRDQNPYNENHLATVATRTLAATGRTLTGATIDWNTAGMPSGSRFYLCARITDGTRTRYLYW